MTWQDNLLAASFRGIPFLYFDARRRGGRRLVNNEFPQRDDNYVEDLGLKAKTHQIQAFVLGSNYDQDRDALEDALDAAGSGTLVHPYKGNLTVAVEDYTIEESIENGGMARFDIVFINAGSQPSPTSSSNTADQADQAGLDQQDTLAGDFGALYQLQGLPSFIQDALAGNVTGLVNDLTSLAGLPGLPVGGLDGALTAISDAIGIPVELGLAITGFFTSFVGLVADMLPVDDPTFSSRGQPPVADPSYGLAAFATWGGDLPQVPLTTPQRIQQSTNQAALITLVQGGAVAAMAQLYASTNFVSADDAESARQQMDQLVDTQATVAADIGDDTAFNGWMTLYAAVSTDLTARALQLPEIVNLEFGGSMPALVLAERIYQDGGRAPDLISRNAAPHPLFMSRQIEALAA